jgi:UDP-N-acetylmuramoyl-tripeptide--D-alanyl-D-alanine ligase
MDNKADILVKKNSLSQNSYQIDICIFGDDYTYEIPAIGKHNIGNSMLAIACIVATGLQPKAFLSNSSTIDNFSGRFSSLQLHDNLIVVDDTYNASVSAVKAAIDDLESFDGKKILVVSSMKELGNLSDMYHKEIGDLIQVSGIDNILLFGDINDLQHTLDATKSQDIRYYKSKDKLNYDLSNLLNNYKKTSTKVIIKGARSYKMEEVLRFVIKEFKNK